MSVITLTKARLSFPSLFERAKFNNEEGKYAAVLLIKKGSKDAKMLKKTVSELNKKMKLKSDRLALKDGDDFEYDGYEGNLALKASNNRRPLVIDRDKTPLTKDDDRIYAGCYVNAKIAFWVQDNKFGKRINANLLGVQFHSEGDSFEAGSISADEFEDLEEEF